MDSRVEQFSRSETDVVRESGSSDWEVSSSSSSRHCRTLPANLPDSDPENDNVRAGVRLWRTYSSWSMSMGEDAEVSDCMVMERGEGGSSVVIAEDEMEVEIDKGSCVITGFSSSS